MQRAGSAATVSLTGTTARRRTITVFGTVLLMAVVWTHDRARAAETFKPFTMRSLEGEAKSLAEVSGKVTLVMFFFPTCQYCNAAFPAVQKLYEANRDRGLSIVWINVVPDEERLIADWRAKHRYTVPILLGGRSVQSDYKLVMTPTSYLLDARGRVLWKHAGYKRDDAATLEQEVRQALAMER